MSRYENTPITRKDNQRIFSTTFYPKIKKTNKTYGQVLLGIHIFKPENLNNIILKQIDVSLIIKEINKMNRV